MASERHSATTRRATLDASSATREFPTLMTVDDVSDLLRTTRRAVYAMVERHQLPGVVHIGRRVLVRADELLHWLNQKSASSLRSEQR